MDDRVQIENLSVVHALAVLELNRIPDPKNPSEGLNE